MEMETETAEVINLFCGRIVQCVKHRRRPAMPPVAVDDEKHPKMALWRRTTARVIRINRMPYF
jgi:hypothetical protein